MQSKEAAGRADIERWLIATLADGLARAIESMTGELPQLEVTGSAEAQGAAPGGDGSFWWEQPLTLSSGSAVWVGAEESAWKQIGGRALSAAGIEDAEPSDVRGTYEELLKQGLSALAQAIGGRVGREVVCEGGREARLSSTEGILALRAGFGGAEPGRLFVRFSPALTAALAGDPNGGVSRAKPAGEAEPAQEREAPGGRGETRTLELLLDVELPVSVSFGRAHLPLKDVLKLTSGSIVELNRAVSEPVEVIVNNCVIARGEVVVIEGNYGVRINQIIPREERLRTLN